MSSPYQSAREEGYSDEEIFEHLENHPEYSEKIRKAREEGYSNEEISEFLSSYSPKKEEPKKERSKLEKAGRIAGQYALGVAERVATPYQIAVAPLKDKEAQNIEYRADMGEEIEDLMAQKVYGTITPEDEKHLEHLQKQIADPEESLKYAQSADLSVRGLAEKATGLDLHPEGIVEKAANFTGLIKDPKKIATLAQTGIKSKDVIKAVAPTGTEVLRGAGAGTALQLAEDGHYGPIGTMAALVVGDAAGSGAAGIGKGALKLLSNPKKTMANVAVSFTPTDKKALQQEIIRDFRDSGVQADLGTITDSNIIKWTQARLAQSGYTGKELDNYRKELTNQIKNEYEDLSKGLGQYKKMSSEEVGTIAKRGITEIRDAEKAAISNLYEESSSSLKNNAYVKSDRIGKTINDLEEKLKPGSIKSKEQQVVLNTLNELKRDIYDSEGNLMYANVKELINNKKGIQDVINYEVQGGSKQLLKGLVSEIDRAIISHGKDNPSFARKYVAANKKFSEHAKTFRNKDINRVILSETPEQLMNRMNTVSGIKTLDKVLSKTPEGIEISNQMKRHKLEEIVGNNLVDSTSQQVKLGTFSKLLEKGKNREIVKEILGPVPFKRLENLQKNVGKLSDSNNKFFNTSQSGTVGTDVGIAATAIYQGFNGIMGLVEGNPWLLAKPAALGGGVLAARQLAKLIADPEFLKLAEDAMLSATKSEPEMMINFMKTRPYFQPIFDKQEQD